MLIEFILKESTFDNEKLYHTTTLKNWEKIKIQGLKINSPSNYSIGSLEYMEEVYGIIPIFLSLKPSLNSNDKYGYEEGQDVVLEITNNNLTLVSDIPSISHNGANIELEDGGIWFKRVYDNNGKVIFNHPLSEMKEGISFFDLINDDDIINTMMDLTQTCACLNNISPQLIKRIK